MFLQTPFALTRFHYVINKQGDNTRQCSRVQQVCDRKETTWWEPRSQIKTVCRESGVEPGTCSQSEVSRTSLTTWQLPKGCKHWYPLTPGRRYWTKRSLLSEYMPLQLSLKLTTNSRLLFKNKMRDIFL